MQRGNLKIQAVGRLILFIVSFYVFRNSPRDFSAEILMPLVQVACVCYVCLWAFKFLNVIHSESWGIYVGTILDGVTEKKNSRVENQVIYWVPGHVDQQPPVLVSYNFHFHSKSHSYMYLFRSHYVIVCSTAAEHFLTCEFNSILTDLLKGSFYANPILDVPTNEQLLVKR